MIDDRYTTEDRINLDKINYYYDKKLPCHIILKRVLQNGKHSWLNALVTEKHSDTLFVLKEKELGEIRLSIFEIKDIEDFKEVGEVGRKN